MLGIARHSQYAGWGGGPLKVNFKNTSTLAKTIYTSPAASVDISDCNLASSNDFTNAVIDMTGVTSAANYNNLKMLSAVTFYLDWPSGMSDGDFGSILGISISYDGFDGGGPESDNVFAIVKIVDGSLQFEHARSGFTTTSLPGAYTDYTGKWITMITATSNDASDFEDYDFGFGGDPGSGSGYLRTAWWFTETQEYITHGDHTITSSFLNWAGPSDMSGTDLYVVSNAGNNAGQNQLSYGSSISSSDPVYLNSWWFTLGQMLDPKNINVNTSADENNSLFTSSPSAVLRGSSQAVTAFIAVGINDYSGSFVKGGTSADKYSEDNDYYFKDNSGTLSTEFSSSTYPKDES